MPLDEGRPVLRFGILLLLPAVVIAACGESGPSDREANDASAEEQQVAQQAEVITEEEPTEEDPLAAVSEAAEAAAQREAEQAAEAAEAAAQREAEQAAEAAEAAAQREAELEAARQRNAEREARLEAEQAAEATAGREAELAAELASRPRIEVLNVSSRRDSLGTPIVTVRFRNNHTARVDALQTEMRAFNRFDQPVGGRCGRHITTSSTSRIERGTRGETFEQRYSTLCVDDATRLEVRITRAHFTDGAIWP